MSLCRMSSRYAVVRRLACLDCFCVTEGALAYASYNRVYRSHTMVCVSQWLSGWILVSTAESRNASKSCARESPGHLGTTMPERGGGESDTFLWQPSLGMSRRLKASFFELQSRRGGFLRWFARVRFSLRPQVDHFGIFA